MKKILSVILLVLITNNVSYAFNYSKCVRYLQPFGMFGGITSSTQYSSSSGACSAMASKAEEKKRFFVINYDKFQNEAAQGRGEHLYVFGKLSNCSNLSLLKLNETLKKEYKLLFSSQYEERSYFRVENLTSRVCSKKLASENIL